MMTRSKRIVVFTGLIIAATAETIDCEPIDDKVIPVSFHQELTRHQRREAVVGRVLEWWYSGPDMRGKFTIYGDSKSRKIISERAKRMLS